MNTSNCFEKYHFSNFWGAGKIHYNVLVQGETNRLPLLYDQNKEDGFILYGRRTFQLVSKYEKHEYISIKVIEDINNLKMKLITRLYSYNI